MSTVIPCEILLEQTRLILRAWGAPEEHAQTIATCMHESDLRGIDSHGVGMFPTYDTRRANGGINMQPNITVVNDEGATALIDADNSLGHVPATMGMQMACEKAKAFGIGAVSVRQSNHFGAAGVYSTMASDMGLLGFATTGTSQRGVVPTFAREPRYSTNPIAFAAPAQNNPAFSLDMATSTVAVGKINIARRAGKPLPDGWAVNEAGAPENDADAAFNSKPKRMTPLGGTRELGSHKGYGLAMMVEILSSTLNGSFVGGHNPYGWEPGKYLNVGHFLLAIDPDRFSIPGTFGGRVDQLVDMLHDTPSRDPAQPVMVAGDPEHAERILRAEEGIPMVPKLFDELRDVAQRCGADFLLGPYSN
ncbi:MAG: Ldh family oxidoreductase [Chromatiales bacterium]|jgi:LDH2 family malate/lactate/ureidoglycolate dehydrogenase|nr:Ldh family oxidoreductase [Chromatiales bacterium]